jgi:pimeloyl-[acyl-carrier protein] methyl ester esterase
MRREPEADGRCPQTPEGADPFPLGSIEGRDMDKSALVLLPGMDGTGILFGPLIEHLGKGIAPIVVSYPQVGELTYEQLLPIVRKALPKEAPYVLLGESFSGPLAIMAAAERPENLRAVILCATFVRNPVPWLPSWVRYLTVAPVARLAPSFIVGKALLFGHGKPDLIALLRKAHGRVRAGTMAARARAILSVNAEGALREVTAPIYFIGGAHDKVAPRKNLREIRRVRHDVEVHLIPGPHLILQAKPREAAAVIREIVEKEMAR